MGAARSQRAGALTGRVRHFFRGESIRNAPSFSCHGIGVALMLAAVPASAQYGGVGLSDPATGESYHVEVSGALFNPTPTLLITSEGLGIPGDQIDFVKEFGLEKKAFKQLRVVLRPGSKHKLRYEFIPIWYEQEATITRSVVFNGQRFNVSLPVLAELKWNAMRFSYEYDFIYKDRGYFGLVLDLKYTDVEAALSNALIGREFAQAQAPMPAIGGIGPRLCGAERVDHRRVHVLQAAREHRRGLSRPLLRLRSLRHRQLQRIRRRAGRLPLAQRVLQGRDRYRRLEDEGAVFRGGRPLLSRLAG